MPGHADSCNTQGEWRDSADSDKVIIKGLAPEGAAIKSKELLIGKYQLTFQGAVLADMSRTILSFFAMWL